MYNLILDHKIRALEAEVGPSEPTCRLGPCDKSLEHSMPQEPLQSPQGNVWYIATHKEDGTIEYTFP